MVMTQTCFEATMTDWHDADADLLAEMVANGIDQWEAGWLLWGREPAWDAPAEQWAGWCRVHVRRLFAPLREAVGLV